MAASKNTGKKDSNQYNWFQRNPRATLFLFNFLILAIIFGALEAYLGYENRQNAWFRNVEFNDRQVKLLEYAPNIDTKVYPNDYFLKYVGAQNLKQENYTFRTADNGTIMPTADHPDPDFIIAFLGGSTTENFYVHEQNRFPYRACLLLEEMTDLKLNCYNYGVSGMTSMQSNNILLNKVLEVRPNVAVFMHNINDLTTLTFTSSYWNESNRSMTERKKEKKPYQKIVHLAKATMPNIYGRIKGALVDTSDDEWLEYRKNQLFLQEETILSDYSSSVHTFINICKSWNVQPVIMTQPNRFVALDSGVHAPLYDRANFEEYRELYAKMNEAAREISQADEDVILIDLEEKVPKDTLHLYDLVHLNDQGSILSAKVIADSLKSHLIKFKKL